MPTRGVQKRDSDQRMADFGVIKWGAMPFVLAAAASTGCASGYVSDYNPPRDGRARVVWRDDRAIAVLPSSAADQPCTDARMQLVARPDSYARYGGSPVYVTYRAGVVITGHPRPVIIGGGPSPGYGRPIAAAPAMRRPASPHLASSPGSPSRPSTSGKSSSAGSSGARSVRSGNFPKEVAVVAAVLALLALPAITLGLAAGRPEPSEEVAAEIDRVNVYNDLARVPDSPCITELPASEEQAPAPDDALAPTPSEGDPEAPEAPPEPIEEQVP
jgi:hypothetical protein